MILQSLGREPREIPDPPEEIWRQNILGEPVEHPRQSPAGLLDLRPAYREAMRHERARGITDQRASVAEYERRAISSAIKKGFRAWSPMRVDQLTLRKVYDSVRDLLFHEGHHENNFEVNVDAAAAVTTVHRARLLLDNKPKMIVTIKLYYRPSPEWIGLRVTICE